MALFIFHHLQSYFVCFQRKRLKIILSGYILTSQTNMKLKLNMKLNEVIVAVLCLLQSWLMLSRPFFIRYVFSFFCFRQHSKLMRLRMYLVEQGQPLLWHCWKIYECSKINVYSTAFVFLLRFSGGVMIYFDRIEVVNMLVPSAGIKLSNVLQFLTVLTWLTVSIDSTEL